MDRVFADPRYKRKIVIYIVSGVAVLVAAYLLYLLREPVGNAVRPFLIGMFAAYMMWVPVRKLESKGVPPWGSISIVYAVTGIVLALTMFFVVPQIISDLKDILSTLPKISDSYTRMVNALIMNVQSSDWSKEIKNALSDKMGGIITSVQTSTYTTVTGALGFIAGMVQVVLELSLGLFIAFFILRDSEYISKSILSLLPKSVRAESMTLISDIHAVLARFFRGQLVAASIIGVLQVIGLSLIGVKFSFVVGIIGGAANIIPYFGPYIGGIPAVTVAFLDSPVKAFWTVILLFVIQQIDGMFISPRLMQQNLSMHPMLTIFVILLGQQLFGLMGMLLAVPVAASLKVVLKRLVAGVV